MIAEREMEGTRSIASKSDDPNPKVNNTERSKFQVEVSRGGARSFDDALTWRDEKKKRTACGHACANSERQASSLQLPARLIFLSELPSG